jgi:hypothetical protein
MRRFTPDEDAAFRDVLETTDYVEAPAGEDTDPDDSLASLAEELRGIQPHDPGFEDAVKRAITAVNAELSVTPDDERLRDARENLEALLLVNWGLEPMSRRDKVARVARLARQMNITFAVLNQTWGDQLRVPKGNGKRSGRWTYTPWMHLDDLLQSLEGVNTDEPRDNSAYQDVLPFLAKAEDALGRVNRDNFDVRDPAVADAAREAAQALEEARDALSSDLPDLADRIDEAREAIAEFADTDWSLMDEATDIGRSDVTSGGEGGGRRSNPTLWVWTDPLPSDEPVNDPRTSKELADRLAEIKGHHTAPSPKMRKDRAAAMQELNDRRLRDQDPLAVEREEETDVADDVDWTQDQEQTPGYHTEDWYPEDQTRADESNADRWGIEVGSVAPSYQLGVKQRDRFRALSDNQRIEANYLMRTGSTAEEALKAAAEIPDNEPASEPAPVADSRLTKARDASDLSVGQRVWVEHSGSFEPGSSEMKWLLSLGTVTSTDVYYDDPDVDPEDPVKVSVALDDGGSMETEGWHVVTAVDGQAPPPKAEPAVVPLPKYFRDLFRKFDEGDAEKKNEALRQLYVQALNGRAGRTVDVMPDEAFSAFQTVIGLTKDGRPWNDETREALTNLRERLLENERTPQQWKEFAKHLPKSEPSDKQTKELRESKAAHKAYQQALRDVDVSDGRIARKDIKRLLANLRGQTAEDLRLGVLDEEGAEWIDHYLSMLQDAIDKPSQSEFDDALSNLRHRVANLGDNPWDDTVWTLRDLNQSAWRPTDIWNPPPSPQIEKTLDEILETPGLKSIGVALGLQDLWALSEQEDQDYINKGIGFEKFWLTKALQEAMVAMRAEDFDRWQSIMNVLRMQVNGRNDHWGRAAEKIARVDALGQKILREKAGLVEKNLKARYGELPENLRTREAVIQHIGAFYAVRGTNNNCVLASQAYEMRRRGLDIHPKQAKKGRNSTATQRAWYHAPFDFETVVEGMKGLQAKNRYRRVVEHVKEHYEPGNRGTIRAGWKGRSFGHIWNWEVLEDGSVVFLDAQTGEVIDGGRVDYWGEMDWRYVTLARLDHLTLKEDIEVSFAPKEATEGLTNELLETAKTLQELNKQRTNLLNQTEEARKIYYKFLRQTSASNPQTQAAKERADGLFLQYASVNNLYRTVRNGSEGERLKEIGSAFPFLDPNTYR